MIPDFEEKLEEQEKIVSKIKEYITNENNPQMLLFFEKSLMSILHDLNQKMKSKLNGLFELVKKV